MFYFIFVFIIASTFLLYKAKDSRAIRYSILTMACYTSAMLVFILYIAKDSYYYNAIEYLFSVPLPIWNKILFVSVSSRTLIRLLNFFTLAVIFFSIQFAFSYVAPKPDRRYSYAIFGILAAEYIYYDPKICELIYLHFYPDWLTYQQFISLQNGIHTLTIIINAAFFLLGGWFLWQNYRKSSPIRIIKVSTAGIGLCHALIMFSYLLLFGYYPVCLVKVSKIAGIVSYETAPMISEKWFTSLFPYYLILSFILIAFCIYRTTRISAQLADESFTISKQISAADTTSKAFCHYLKNEILAIQSEIEILDAANKEQDEAFREIRQRCSTLYKRLDFLYKSSKFSSLTLKETELQAVLNRLTKNFSYELHDIQVVRNFPKDPTFVLLDEPYFYQALHNIVSNALDAMSELPKQRRRLILSLECLNNWVYIRIADSGKGIAPEDLPRIFTPFYSSYPIRTHWGIGLSVTYKIINAHEGHIDVESQIDIGTTVKILLPLLHKSHISPDGHAV
jgi:signal transduction histidine kinase